MEGKHHLTIIVFILISFDFNLDYIFVFFIGGLLVARQLFTVKVFQLYGKAGGGTIDS